jgi:hypothetical protein
LAWCRASSLTASVALALKDSKYPISKEAVLKAVEGVSGEGWDVPYLLGLALKRRRYQTLRALMSDLESWLETQG